MDGQKKKYILLVLLIAGFLARFLWIGVPLVYVGDEALHIPATEEYCATGHANPDHYAHPPLKYYLLAGSMKLFGNNPYGWRMRNVVLGSMSIAILFFVGMELFSNAQTAFLAAALFAFDPLHIVLSRSTFDEVPVAFFFLAALYALLRFIRGGAWYLPGAGLFFGLAMAMKWYFAPALLILLLFTLFITAKREGWSWLKSADIMAAFTVIPLAVYLLVFTAWFDRGFGFMEFLQMQRDAFNDLQMVESTQMHSALASGGSPWQWFLMPLIIIRPIGQDGNTLRMLAVMNNPLVWVLVIPALLYFGYRIVMSDNRSATFVLIPLVFLSTYLPWLFVRRQIFLYSAVACLPVALLAVSHMVTSLSDSMQKLSRAYIITATVLIAGSLYFYPLTIGLPVNADLYVPVLTFAKTLRTW